PALCSFPTRRSSDLVYQDIKRGAVLAAPTDSAVIQGRVAIDQAVRALEKKPFTKHTGPAIYIIDKSNINAFHYESSLAPADFKRSEERRVGKEWRNG